MCSEIRRFAFIQAQQTLSQHCSKSHERLITNQNDRALLFTFLGVGGSVMTVPLLRRRGLSMTQATAMAGMYDEAQTMQREIDQSHLLSRVELANMEELTLKVAVYDRLLNPRPEPLILPDETECLFGKWYYEQQDPNQARTAEFRRLEVPHQLVHSSGQAAINAHAQGELEKTLEHVGKMEAANVTVMQAVKVLLKSRLGS